MDFMDKSTMNNWVVDNNLYKITSNDQPWLINDDGTVIVSPTISDNGSTRVTLTAKQEIIVSFTAEASSESGCDYGHVIISGIEDTFSDTESKSYRELISAGESIILMYTKDSSVDSYDDSFYIKNLEVNEYEEEETTVEESDMYTLEYTKDAIVIDNEHKTISNGDISGLLMLNIKVTAKQPITVTYHLSTKQARGEQCSLSCPDEDKSFSSTSSNITKGITIDLDTNDIMRISYVLKSSHDTDPYVIKLSNFSVEPYKPEIVLLPNEEEEVTKYITVDNIRTLLQLLKPRLVNTFEISVDDLSDTYLDVYNKCITDIHQCKSIVFNHDGEWYPVTRYAIIGDNIHLYSCDLNKHIMMNNEGAISIVGDDEEDEEDEPSNNATSIAATSSVHDNEPITEPGEYTINVGEEPEGSETNITWTRQD